MIFIKTIVSGLIVGLFLFSKLLPYKEKLSAKYRNLFDIFQNIFTPVLNGLRSVIQPFEVGPGLSIDMTQMVLLVILLIINSLL